MTENEVRAALLSGGVIPAHPLALTSERKLDEKRQVALTRYYVDAGSCGIAVGVHTTQFEIRKPGVGLLKPVLSLAAEAARAWTKRPTVLVAGICGDTTQACKEAALARELGYHVGLLALRGKGPIPVEKLLAHARAVAEELPLMGFYLQEAVGGRPLPYEFWRSFFEIPRVMAVKVAPFNRYRTLEVVRALAHSGRTDIALYTGNDDNIVFDLLTAFPGSGCGAPIRFAGGLLGQWAVWTRRAVQLVEEIRTAVSSGTTPQELLSVGAALTDANAAVFDARNGFAGCIPGVHEVLRRQGFLKGRWCLDPEVDLSPQQAGEIERVWKAYPFLRDDAFVRENLARYFA